MLGEAILRQRQALSMTQDQLASGVCSRSYLSRIEHNGITPSPNIMIKLGEKLGLCMTDWVEYYLQDSIGANYKDLFLLARALARNGLFDHVNKFIAKAEESAAAGSNDHSYQGEKLAVQGHILSMRGKRSEALKVYQDLLTLRKRRPSRRFELAHAYFTAGNAAIYAGDYDQALTNLFTGLSRLLCDDPDSMPQDTKRIVHLHHIMTQALMHVLFTKQQYRFADALLNVIFARWEEMSIPGNVPDIQLSRGINHLQAGSFSAAIDVFREVIATTDDAVHMICAYTNLGLTYLGQGEPARALASLEIAWDLHDDADYFLSRRRVANGIIRCYINLGRLDQAHEWEKIADSIVDEGTARYEPILPQETLLLKAELRLREDRPEKALCHLENVNPDVINDAAAQMISLMKAEALLQGGQVEGAFDLISEIRTPLWKDL